MPDEKAVPKSLIEQINDELVKRLEGKEGFDADLIERIKELSRSDELNSHAKMQAVLKS
jgi:hypothetical protein